MRGGRLATTIPDQLWSQDSTGIKDTAEVDDGFGSALTMGDFDGDGYDDLAVGVPFEDNNVATDFGATNVLYGSPSGLTDTGDQFWSQDSADVNGVIEDEDSDWFASALAAGDFNGDGRDDLGIGVGTRTSVRRPTVEGRTCCTDPPRGSPQPSCRISSGTRTPPT
jgi:FG-GAP repeat